MNNKFKKTIFSSAALLLAVSALCIPSFGVDEEETTETPAIIEPIVIDPVEEEEVTQKPEKKEPPKKNTVATTEKQNTEKTAKSTEAVITEADNDAADADDVDDDDRNVVPDNGASPNTNTATAAKKTGFTVYIELNNGERRLRYDLKKPGLVTEPKKQPERKGFVFDGYYVDEKFTEKWDFNKNVAKEGTVIFVKWKADNAGKLYNIEVARLVGGKIMVNPAKAAAGEQVNITVVPDEGNRMKDGTLTINGEVTDFFSFKMGEEPVVISAEFERIPLDSKAADSSTKKIIFVVFALVCLMVAAFIAVMFIRRRTVYEKETLNWIDDSIVVEKGFKDGKFIKGDEEKEFVELDENSFLTLDDDDLK